MNEIQKLREEFNAKLDKLEKKEEKKVGEEYWSIGNDGCKYCEKWEDDGIDNGRLETGNVFFVEKEAEDEIERRKAIVTIKTYIKEHFPFEPDWDDEKQEKYIIIYSNGSKGYYPDYDYCEKRQTQIGFLATKENAEEIINKFSKELGKI